MRMFISKYEHQQNIIARFSASLLRRSPPWSPCRRSAASIRASEKSAATRRHGDGAVDRWEKNVAIHWYKMGTMLILLGKNWKNVILPGEIEGTIGKIC